MMISVEKMSFGFPEKDLYNEVSFSIERGEKCALIGSNGTGKTTLVDMLINDEEYLYTGKIRKDKAERIGYVNQFLQSDKDRQMTVYDYLAQPFLKAQADIDAVCDEMARQADDPGIFDKYQDLIDAFDAIDGYNYDTNIHRQLKLAGLSRLTDLNLDALSGGEYKLLQIVGQMMQLPDLLIMDEPDVFLDFENLVGLVRLIKSYKGTLLAVTHSRYLLYHCFNKIIHLENADIQEFSGTYAEYNMALLEGKIKMMETAIKDQEEIDRQNAVVTRLRVQATKIAAPALGRSLNARVSYLNRLIAGRTKMPFVEVPHPKISLPLITEESQETIADQPSVIEESQEVVADQPSVIEESQEVVAVQPSVIEESQETVAVQPSVIEESQEVVVVQPSVIEESQEAVAVQPSADRPILEVRDYAVSFDELILDSVSFTLGRHEKVAIVGPNGTGKTTLLRAIAKACLAQGNELAGFSSEDGAQDSAENGALDVAEDNAVNGAFDGAEDQAQNGAADGAQDANEKILLAPDARAGFLSQLYGHMLDEKKKVSDLLDEELAENYLFTGEELDKTVGVLSGGEKNMLQLALISKSQANLLLLDEPTSHLDIYAQAALENAIRSYNGAVLMVSHDFYTIAGCADTVYYVENKTLRRMSGRAFRKMIYKNYFDKDYLEVDARGRQLETKIMKLLGEGNYKKASSILEDYEAMVRQII